MKNTAFLIEAETGDWQKLYINGKLFAEGHQIDIDSWLDAFYTFGIKVDIQWMDATKPEWEKLANKSAMEFHECTQD